jgi:glucose/arabinose dehydrogenase
MNSPLIRSVVGLVGLVACFAFAESAAADPPLSTRLVAQGFDFPTFVTAAPGDHSRLFVVEKNSGRIRVVDPVTGAIHNKNFLSVFPLISSGSERGLLGLAFHPGYALNGLFYICYTDLQGDVVLARYVRSAGNPYLADSNSGVILLEEPKPFMQHNGGMLQFGPDGYLYMSIGDGGGGYDPFNFAQRLDNLKGKVLRLDVTQLPYAIPPSNPFVNVPGARPEIFAYGLRNPWRFSVDSATGNLFIGDVGQEQREEIDFIPAASGGGQNFGWRCMEGDVCTGVFTGCDCNQVATYTAPIHVYDHSQGTAIVGGYVYRGCAMPWLQGVYFFADYGFGRVYTMRYDGSTITEFTERTAELDPPGPVELNSISSFGVDARGEIYLVDYSSGEIFQIVPQLPAGPDCNGNTIPDGCEIASGAMPDVNADGVIDQCVPSLAATNLYLGSSANFQFGGASTGEIVYFAASLTGTAPLSACLTPSLCVSLAQPLFVVTAIPADGAGVASFSVFVPPDLPIPSFTMQAIVLRGAALEASLLSNVLDATLGPPPGP